MNFSIVVINIDVEISQHYISDSYSSIEEAYESSFIDYFGDDQDKNLSIDEISQRFSDCDMIISIVSK